MSRSRSFDRAKPGDLIEIYRPGYQHWAIYIGNGYVIHLAPASEYAQAGAASIMSAFAGKAVISKDLLVEVAGTDKYKVNNKYDNRYIPLPVSDIIKNAEEMVGEEIPFSLMSSNCEYYVTDLRYGIRRSDQVKNAVVVGGLVAALGVIGLIAYSRYHSQKRGQKQ